MTAQERVILVNRYIREGISRSTDKDVREDWKGVLREFKDDPAEFCRTKQPICDYMTPLFEFPLLGDCGAGPVINIGAQGQEFWSAGIYAVSRQQDHPACAFRCHYRNGSAPCDWETAIRFIRWAKAAMLPTDKDEPRLKEKR